MPCSSPANRKFPRASEGRIHLDVNQSGGPVVESRLHPVECLVLFSQSYMNSNRLRPAWEVIRHSNLNHLEGAGVRLESTVTPGKTVVNRGALLLECNCAAVLNQSATFFRTLT
jgi:hypothetical protein